MLRTTTIVLAGLLLAGCQESDMRELTAHHGGVQGEKDYGGDVQGTMAYHNRAVYGDPRYTDGTVSGEKAYRDDSANARTASVRSTETVVNTPATPSEVRTSADVRAPADVKADLQRSTSDRTTDRTTDIRTTETRETARTPAEIASDVNRANANDVNRPATPATPADTSARTPADTVVIGSGKADPERVAFAKTAQYPADLHATDDLRATALIQDNGIKIANATDREIHDVKVWIDGTYVSQVNSIPAHGSVTVERKAFADRNGNLPSDTKGFKQVQLQTRDNLYNLQGPVFENR